MMLQLRLLVSMFHYRMPILSVSEALKHAGYALDAHIKIKWLNAEKVTPDNVEETLGDCDGILVPGGFGKRATPGKITAIQYAREHKIPFFGICYGDTTCSY